MGSSITKQRAAIEALLLDLYDEFARLNVCHFDGSLPRPLIELSTRKTFGGYYSKSRNRIVLSWQAYCEYGLDETLNTLRHEIAHIVYQNHGPEFWTLALRLGVERKYARHPLKRRARKALIYECPNCGTRLQRVRRMPNSSCARCDRKYNPAYVMKLVEEMTLK
jgi:predicted SprT family Zn-dependent metalloprotease